MTLSTNVEPKLNERKLHSQLAYYLFYAFHLSGNSEFDYDKIARKGFGFLVNSCTI